MICKSCNSKILADDHSPDILDRLFFPRSQMRRMMMALGLIPVLSLIIFVFACILSWLFGAYADKQDPSEMDIRMREYSISIVRDVVREEMRKIARTEEESRFNEVILSEETIRRIVQDEMFVLADD